MATIHMQRMLFIIVALGGVTARAADKATPDQIEFFEKKIRPVLAQQCYSCHSHSSEKVKGNLLLDSRQAMLKGGKTGPAIVEGNPGRSSLIKAVKWIDDDTRMPPKKQLDPQAIKDLEQWVAMGAPWPAFDLAKGNGAAGYAAEYDRLRKELWSWQPIKNPAPPTVKDTKWPKSNIDQFILARLEAKNLTPALPADKLTLLRRATYDLTGLPPTPEEIDAFARDSSPNAFEKVIDRLLASSRFGERWGRHWLDVARFAESSGFTRNLVYHYAWRYRDWVIEALNADKPYDQFVTEQIAGDLLPATSAPQRDKNIIATGFLCVGTRDYNERNPRQAEYNAVDEMIDTTSRAMLGTTIACARCHDHKFDPIPTAEYYALAGVFMSSKEYTGLHSRRGANRIDQFDEDELIKLSDYRAPAAGRKKAKDEEETKAEAREAIKKIMSVRMRGGDYDRPQTAIKPFAMGVKDDPRPTDVRILSRGELDHPGDVVKRGFLSIPAIKDPPAISASTSGRLEYARWIMHPDNPLTARVMANRIWQHLFGKGIVETVDNFGVNGDKPTHPELLDYLATQFKQNGWSIKKQIKQVMLSSAYQQASTFDKAKFALDPENHLLWRQNQRRLEAEAIRDTMLAAGGKINLAPPIGSIAIDLPSVPIGGGGGRFSPADMVASTSHRSIYLPIMRNLVPEALDVFDFADSSNVTGQRDVTTVPPQALYLLNNGFVVRMSRDMANRVAGSQSLTELARVDQAYKLALGRPANAAERDRALTYISHFMRDPKSANSRDPNANRIAAWSSLCQALFACAEFRYLN